MSVAIAVFFPAGWKQGKTNSICHKYDKYCGLAENLVSTGGVDLDMLFNQDRLFDQAEIYLKILGKSLNATSVLIDEIWYGVSVIEKRHASFMMRLSWQVIDAR